MFFLKTAIREAELVNVPIVSAKGTRETGSSIFNMGSMIRLAPPPAIALIQKANITATKSIIVVESIIFF